MAGPLKIKRKNSNSKRHGLINTHDSGRFESTPPLRFVSRVSSLEVWDPRILSVKSARSSGTNYQTMSSCLIYRFYTLIHS
jgi:hypothetical protein